MVVAIVVGRFERWRYTRDSEILSDFRLVGNIDDGLDAFLLQPLRCVLSKQPVGTVPSNALHLHRVVLKTPIGSQQAVDMQPICQHGCDQSKLAAQLATASRHKCGVVISHTYSLVLMLLDGVGV